MVPSRRATAVAPTPAATEVPRALRAPLLWDAATHQFRVSPVGGNEKVFDSLKELTTIRISGMYSIASPIHMHTRKKMRKPRENSISRPRPSDALQRTG